MKKSLLLSFIISCFLFFPSCATTSQLYLVENKVNDLSKQVENKVNVLSKKVDEFSVKYSEILSENKMLQEKLNGMVPLATSEVKQVQFEVVSAKRSGSTLKIEVVITNKREEFISLDIENSNVTITDEFANNYKDYLVENSKYTVSVKLFPSAPIKVIITVNNFNPTSKTVGVLGFSNLYIPGERLTTSLKNIPVE